MKKILIIGASSSIGRYFIDSNFKNQSVYTYFKNPINNAIKFDLTKDNINKLIDLENIQLVILLSAISDPNICYFQKQNSFNINVKKTKELLDVFFKKKIKVIFFSSEYIYDGKNGYYNESDLVNPILEYGKQKNIIEKFIENKSENFIILRIAKTYTQNPNEKSIIANWYKDFCIKKLPKLDIAFDQILSPLYVNDIPKIIKCLIDNNFNGKINIGGPKILSRYECLKIFLDVFKINNISLIKKSINDFNLPELRPLNTSFNISLLKNNIDFELKEFRDVCINFYGKIKKI